VVLVRSISVTCAFAPFSAWLQQAAEAAADDHDPV